MISNRVFGVVVFFFNLGSIQGVYNCMQSILCTYVCVFSGEIAHSFIDDGSMTSND